MNKRILGLTGFSIVAVSVALYAGSAALGQQTEPLTPRPPETFTEYGRATRKVIEPSDKGNWDGTWFYVNRDGRIVIWIKTEDGVPLVKVQYFSLATAEGFATDWSGTAEYEMPGSKGSFSMNVKKRDANVIEGRWDWRVESAKASRIDQGDYRMYRTGDGRFFVMDFAGYRRIRAGINGERVSETYPAWTFQKASKRLVLWDELPF